MIFFGVAALIATAIIFAYTRCVRSTALVIVFAHRSRVAARLVALFGFELDPFSILVPFLVFAIGVSHGAQKMNGIMQDIGRGTVKLVAARYTFRRLFLPASPLIADAVGFAVLMVIDIPVIQDRGHRQHRRRGADLHQSLLLPGAFVVHRVSKRAAEHSLKEEREETRGRGLGKLWLFLDRFTTRPYAIGAIAASAILAIRSGYTVSTKLAIGDLDPGAPELRKDSRYNLDSAFVTNNYALSSDQFAVIVKTDRDGCLKYETLVEADRLGWALRQVPGVQTTVSLADSVRQITAGSFEGSPKWMTLNRNQDVLNFAGQQTSSNNPDLFNLDCSVMPVIAYLADHKAETLDRVVAATEAFAQQHNEKGREFLLAAGTAGIEAATNIVVRKAWIQMLLYVYAAVIVLCFITFRSWRAVVVAVVPPPSPRSMRGADGVARHGRQGGHSAGDRAGCRHRRRLCAVPAVGAARAARRGNR
jgi:predicted RND superfamily exporter protein